MSDDDLRRWAAQCLWLGIGAAVGSGAVAIRDELHPPCPHATVIYRVDSPPGGVDSAHAAE